MHARGSKYERGRVESLLLLLLMAIVERTRKSFNVQMSERVEQQADCNLDPASGPVPFGETSLEVLVVTGRVALRCRAHVCVNPTLWCDAGYFPVSSGGAVVPYVRVRVQDVFRGFCVASRDGNRASAVADRGRPPRRYVTVSDYSTRIRGSGVFRLERLFRFGYGTVSNCRRAAGAE